MQPQSAQARTACTANVHGTGGGTMNTPPPQQRLSFRRCVTEMR
jgi:hypothetical protein